MSVSWLGSVTIGGWSYVAAVDVGGSEGGSCEGMSLNGMGKSLGCIDDVGAGSVSCVGPWDVLFRLFVGELFSLVLAFSLGLGLGLATAGSESSSSSEVSSMTSTTFGLGFRDLILARSAILEVPDGEPEPDVKADCGGRTESLEVFKALDDDSTLLASFFLNAGRGRGRGRTEGSDGVLALFEVGTF